MSVTLKFSIIPSQDALSFYFKEDTGIYSATNNPTGWGSPNPATSAMTSATLTITLVNDTTVVFNSGNGFYPLFPNTNGSLFKITNVLLGLDDEAQITDWISLMTYATTDGGSNSFSTSKYVFVNSQSLCCVANLLSRVTTSDCNCGNQNMKTWQRANLMLKGVQGALDCSPQLPNKATDDLSSLTDLCNNNDCNCQ